jgi:Xaa-Pro aminopeptidase
MKAEIFAQRRANFLEHLGEGAMALVMAAPHAKRNDDVHYEYRTCSYFYYLTGVKEQEAAAIFRPGSSTPFQLFVLPKNPLAELWEGKRIGVEAAAAVFGAQKCYPIEELEKVFREELKQAHTLYHALGNFPEQDDFVFRVLKEHQPNPRRGDKKFQTLAKVQDLVAPMRKVKSSAEIDLMRVNCRSTAEAHRRAMEFTRPGQFEYQVEAEIEFWFRHGGAEDLAYSSIVAGGDNATVLHYKTNRDPLKEGDLLLIDAGGEMGHYASDITRTFPVSGRFTAPQKQLYEITLQAQKAAIAAVKPGVPFHDIHQAAVKELVSGLLRIGLLKGKLEEIIKDRKNYDSFYPHNTSHWIGLDVHDCGDYFLPNGDSIPLAEGNALTIEPGLYIAADRMDVPAEYRGIGIRIEDDVVVTKDGCEVLTVGAPKEVEEIEAVVGKARSR